MKILTDYKMKLMPFDLVAFIGGNRSIIQEEVDERSALLEEIDFSQAQYLSCLEERETRIDGDEKLLRLKKNGGIILGVEWLIALWQNWKDKDNDSVLARLYESKIIPSNVDFFGTPLISSRGQRCVLSLYYYKNEWCCGAWRFQSDFHGEITSIVLPQD